MWFQQASCSMPTAGDHIKSSSPPPPSPQEQPASSEEESSIGAQPGAENSKGAWLRGMVTGMSERTKEALVPSIKNGRALLKSLGGMQISGMSPSEPAAKDSSHPPEPGMSGALAESPFWSNEIDFEVGPVLPTVPTPL